MKELKGSLYTTMLMMVVLPMVIITIAVSALCTHHYLKEIYRVVETELSDICHIANAYLEEKSPGDYTMTGEEQKTILKGDTVLNGDHSIPDLVKADTDVEITLFYYDTRILTTIRDEKGDRIVGTPANAAVMRDVYNGGEPGFYKNVSILGRRYYTYYMPLRNSDGSVAAMLGAVKPVDGVNETSIMHILPIGIMMLVMVFIEALICMYWSRNTIKHIGTIQKFLMVMAEGRFSRELNPEILSRDDEIGRLGTAIVKVQAAVRDLIERDMLTGLNNRRFGVAKLMETQRMSDESGIPFCVVMCDIDHFKSFNDTYGHDAGDLVLKEVARLLRTHMAGKGFAVRWGGEEFLLVYTQINMAEAVPKVEAIMEAIRNLDLEYGGAHIRLTMTFGMADGRPRTDMDSFLKEADDRLYYGKENGRNQVVSQVPWWTEKKPEPRIEPWQPETLGRQDEDLSDGGADVSEPVSYVDEDGWEVYIPAGEDPEGMEAASFFDREGETGRRESLEAAPDPIDLLAVRGSREEAMVEEPWDNREEAIAQEPWKDREEAAAQEAWTRETAIVDQPPDKAPDLPSPELCDDTSPEEEVRDKDMPEPVTQEEPVAKTPRKRGRPRKIRTPEEEEALKAKEERRRANRARREEAAQNGVDEPPV